MTLYPNEGNLKIERRKRTLIHLEVTEVAFELKKALSHLHFLFVFVGLTSATTNVSVRTVYRILLSFLEA